MYNTNVCRYVLHLYNICIQIHAIGRQLLITVHNELLANSTHRCWPPYIVKYTTFSRLNLITLPSWRLRLPIQVMEKNLWCNRK